MIYPTSLPHIFPDLRSELCKGCLHTKVCRLDKNLVGDVFVPPHPFLGESEAAWQRYKEREAAGFPCEDYLSSREYERLQLELAAAQTDLTYFKDENRKLAEAWQNALGLIPSKDGEGI